jgi:serine/threonine protein phosphatase 1
MRLLVIGDIHGCLQALTTLLEQVRPTAEDELVTLGDYIDRGPDSRGVLDLLIELYGGGRLVPLRGNHDEMMMAAREGRERRMWLACGGRQTLESYGMHGADAEEMQKIPDRHWVFLAYDCRDWYETEDRIFVHGGLDPNLEMRRQSAETLRWEKLYAPVNHCSGKLVVCGHTRQPDCRPRREGNTVWVDTGVYDASGWLTCLDVTSGEFWQANQRGETRDGQLSW